MTNLIAKTLADRRLADIVGPVVEGMGFELVRVRYMSGAATLQIMAERPEGGIELDECAEISRAVGAVLDVEDPIGDAYSLEVSSPGLDRPLTRAKDFLDFEGFGARLETGEPVDGRRRFRGRLAGVEDGEVALDVDDETVRLRIDSLSDARLEPDWAALGEEADRARGRAPGETGNDGLGEDSK